MFQAKLVDAGRSIFGVSRATVDVGMGVRRMGLLYRCGAGCAGRARCTGARGSAESVHRHGHAERNGGGRVRVGVCRRCGEGARVGREHARMAAATRDLRRAITCAGARAVTAAPLVAACRCGGGARRDVRSRRGCCRAGARTSVPGRGSATICAYAVAVMRVCAGRLVALRHAVCDGRAVAVALWRSRCGGRVAPVWA